MSQESRFPGAPGADKLEIHHRQQLSALVDGELAPDEARFLLRRLEHDQELAGCYERWQLAGQVLRGQARSLAGPGLAAGVAAAIRVEPAPVAVAHDGRAVLSRWGGGMAALAASVAAVAFWVGRPQLPAAAPGVPVVAESAAPVAADTPQLAEAGAGAAVVEVAEAAEVAAGSGPRPAPVAVASQPATRPASASPRRTSAPRAVAPAAAAPPAVVEAGPALDGAAVAALPEAGGVDPFASASPLQARPWPRAALPQVQAGAYTASFGQEPAAPAFYPFEPRLPEAEAGSAPAREPAVAPPAGPGDRQPR